MINIRQGVFETNSSSVHSVCLLTESEYSKWKSGSHLLNMSNNSVVDLNKAVEDYSKDEDITINELAADWDLWEFDLFMDTDYEVSIDEVAKNGQLFYIVSYYGTDY